MQQSWLIGGGMLAAGVVLVVAFLLARKKTSVGIRADDGAAERYD